jgi:hypothetical protein
MFSKAYLEGEGINMLAATTAVAATLNGTIPACGAPQ